MVIVHNHELRNYVPLQLKRSKAKYGTGLVSRKGGRGHALYLPTRTYFGDSVSLTEAQAIGTERNNGDGFYEDFRELVGDVAEVVEDVAGAVGNVAGLVKSASRLEKNGGGTGDGLTYEQRLERQTQGITDAAFDEVLKAAEQKSSVKKYLVEKTERKTGQGFFYVRE